MENEIQIALLQELWLKNNEPFTMKNFELISRRREAGYGGVGVLIRQDLPSKEIDFPDLIPIEVVGVTVEQLAGFGKLNFISAYWPPSGNLTNDTKGKVEQLFAFIDGLEGESMISADLNAHHPNWSPNPVNCR